VSIRQSKKLPPARTIIGAVDQASKDTMQQARREVLPIVMSETPRKRGIVAQDLRPRTSQTKSGRRLTVGATRRKRHDSYATIAQVMRWVQRGTGVRRDGPGAKNRVRPKGALNRLRGASLSVYGRQYSSVAGQRPNPFMARIAKRGGDVFERVAGGRGPKHAADTVERVLR
jgi:hypothetical protein